MQAALSTDVLQRSIDFGYFNFTALDPTSYPLNYSYFQEPPGFDPITPEARLFADPDTQPALPEGVFYYRGGSPLSDQDFYWIVDNEPVITEGSGGTTRTPPSSTTPSVITNKSRGDMSIGFHRNNDPDNTISRLFIQFPNPFRDRIQSIPDSLADEARNVTATLLY